MTIKIGNLELKSRVYVPPMAGVTDIVFRDIIRSVDKECMLSTEMVSSRALMNRPDPRIMDLSNDERPIGIQLFGHEPEIMVKAAKMAEAKGADFVDVNMGCPVPKITKGKDGCALMKEPELAKEIIKSIRSEIKIPLSVKFRLGWDDTSRNCVEFGLMLEEAGANAVTVHGRTRQQLYSGKADWNNIKLVKDALSIPVFGNGDVFEPEDAMRLLEVTGCDGVAVARGTLGNPWLIANITKYLNTGVLDKNMDQIERLLTAYRHCLGLIRYKGERIGTNESRRHLTQYTKGITGSAPFRARLTQIACAADAAVALADVAELADGMVGRKRFLLGVQQCNLSESKHPGKGTSQAESSFHPPVDLRPVAPVAEPHYAVDK